MADDGELCGHLQNSGMIRSLGISHTTSPSVVTTEGLEKKGIFFSQAAEEAHTW